MSAIDNTPSNRNFLSPLNFKFQIKKTPHVNFFIQKASIPQIKLQNTIQPNPFVEIPIPGDHISYDTLSVTFKIDEDLKNYLEIHNWIKSIGKPQTFEQYKNIADKSIESGEGIYSDISLLVLSSTKMPNYEINFVDAFPIALSGLPFNTTDGDVNYIEAEATFKYTYYDINNI